ncbi:ninja-family AFP3-like [Olea europaea subsp. europaea]|uniref:Ninja-family AFP3-like n=1 Tax=Olea europaea subsp. europaea TaxID=158383 RepID=A0A8S0V888_OLEEU|nr:ninja-family AFP3-like [Olea europaea subsp. europaea]
MNGRYSVNPKMAANKLKRSSSISNLAFTKGASGVSGFGEGGWQKMGVSIDLYARLMRTCSLPIEAKKELRKRKELQSMTRIEMPSSQGSIGSHGSGSLGITDFQSPRLDVLILFD